MPFSFPKFCKKHYSVILLGLIIVFYFFNGVSYLRQQSITSDEGAFMGYTIRFLKGQPERISPRGDHSRMPVNTLNLIPRIAEQTFGTVKQKSDWGYSDTMNGRYVTLIISILIILLVYKWANELYGEKAGLFAALLMSLCPNSLSNAALVTTDCYSSLFLLLSMYLLWKFCLLKHNKYFIYFSIAVALSQLVKQSLFHLYVLAPVCMMIFIVLNKERFKWVLFGKRLLIFILINIVIINAGFYFYRSFTTLGEYTFMSHLFQSVQAGLPHWLPLPFPKPFVDGLDMAKYYDQFGGGVNKVSSFGKPTILGESRNQGSFWYYYFVTIFYKTPIAYFIFFFWGAVLLAAKTRMRRFVTREFFLLAPVVYFLVLMNFFYQTQIGIRQLIFIYPFIFIFAAGIVPHLKSLFSKCLLAIVCLFLVISVFRYWSNYYPYTNEFILDKKMAYMKVGTGNLEFHQGYFFAKRYMEKHPDVQFVPEQPRAGRFLIDTEQYLDVWNRHKYDWITSFKPIDHVAYSYLLIKVDSSDIINLNIPK